MSKNYLKNWNFSIKFAQQQQQQQQRDATLGNNPLNCENCRKMQTKDNDKSGPQVNSLVYKAEQPDYCFFFFFFYRNEISFGNEGKSTEAEMGKLAEAKLNLSETFRFVRFDRT